MVPHSSTRAWKIPRMEEPGRLQSMGSRRVGHDWATSLSFFTFHFHALEKDMATYSSVLAWRIPGTHRVEHDLVSEHTHTHTHTQGRLLLFCFLFDFHSFSVYSCMSYILTNQMNRTCIFVNKRLTLSRDQIFCLMAIRDVSGKAQIRSLVDFSSGEEASLWDDVM